MDLRSRAALICPAGERKGVDTSTAHASERESRQRPHGEGDTFARTGYLFGVLVPMLLVVGLIILTGAFTSTAVLIGGVVLLVLMTYWIVGGTVHMINLPPEDGEEERDAGPEHLA